MKARVENEFNKLYFYELILLSFMRDDNYGERVKMQWMVDDK